MDRMNRSLPDIRRRLVDIKKWLDHPMVKAFQKAHPHIPEKSYQKSLSELRQMIKENGNCQNCPGLENCPNLYRGHALAMTDLDGVLMFQLKPCDLFEKEETEKRRKRLISSHYIPEHLLPVTFEDIEQDQGRADAIAAAVEFCFSFTEKNPPTKGLYFHGSFGVGKTRLICAMSNMLAQFGVDSYLLYVPDFVREIHDAIGDRTVNEKLEALKTASVLFLDDIGAEPLTPWIRDEVLGVILQERMNRQLPTVYTSNLALDELEEHFSYTPKGGVERVKAQRIMERIRHRVTAIEVIGRNRRAEE